MFIMMIVMTLGLLYCPYPCVDALGLIECDL